MSLRTELQELREDIRRKGGTADSYAEYYRAMLNSHRGRRWFYEDQARLIKLTARVLQESGG